jgi:putative transposase
MPDHMHALLEGLSDDSDFRECVRQFKHRSALAWKRHTGAVLWQRGYYERALRREEDTFDVARYILGNPLRAGLVKVLGEFPYSGFFTIGLNDVLGSL